MESKYREIKFTDSDIVNIDDWVPNGESNPAHTIPWMITNHGFILAVVFADCEGDALDIAVDDGRLDFLEVQESDLADYVVGKDSEGNDEYEGILYLGNFGKPFDSESLEIIPLPNPPRSFCAQFNAFRSASG